MTTPTNRFKAALATGRVQRGLFLALGSEAVTEIAGHAGFDFCLIDGEHAPYDPTLIRRQLQVLDAAGAVSAVRVPVGEDWVLKQVLDLGAQTIMVPMVETAAQARAAVAACLYPPEGHRGMGGYTMRASLYGGNPTYPEAANGQISLILQIESAAGLAAIEEIAGVAGVDCLFIGPADLGADLGFRDALDDQRLWDEIEGAVRRIRAAGVAAGVFVPPHRVAAMVAAGAGVLAIGTDSALATLAFRAAAGARP